MGTSTRFQLWIPSPILTAMIDHARAEMPNECCGLLAGMIAPDGTEARVTHRYPLINALNSATEFESEPRSMLTAMRDIRQWQTDVLAVYHSHPTSEPIPSRKDLARHWLGESVLCLIIGWVHTEPDIRAWWLREDSYEKGELITEESDSERRCS